MPNWCDNAVTFTHSDRSLIQKIADCENNLFSLFLPIPEEINDAKDDSWYYWCNENWGVKWDVDPRLISDIIETPEGNFSVKIGFASAWGPPITFYNFMVNELNFGVEAMYHESGMCFYGYYEDGADSCNNFRNFADIPDDIVDEFCLEDFDEEEDDECQGLDLD